MAIGSPACSARRPGHRLYRQPKYDHSALARGQQTMWTPIGPGHGRQLTAAEDQGAVSWCLELRASGEEPAVVLTGADVPLGLTLRLRAGEGAPWPAVAESYARGEDFVVVMPQTAASGFGITLQARLLESDQRRAVAELLIAIQTDLLDCHPRLEICTPPASLVTSASPASSVAGAAETGRSLANHPTASAADDGEGPGQAARLQLTEPAAGHAALLFGGGDGPVQVDGAGEAAACFRLFGEFLEKGVIRKARPWIGLWRDGPPDDQELVDLLEQRRCRPLPLTT